MTNETPTTKVSTAAAATDKTPPRRSTAGHATSTSTPDAATATTRGPLAPPWGRVRRIVTNTYRLLLALAAFALAWHAWQWQRARDLRSLTRTVHAAPVPDTAASAAARPDADVRLLVVQATRLRTQGHHDDAVRILQALAARGDLDRDTAQVVRFNLGNELLALALQHNRKDDEDRAMTLVELAKQRYREVLRAQPQHWDARHNLDLALRLVPESEPPPPPEKPTNVQRIQVDLRGIRGVDLP